SRAHAPHSQAKGPAPADPTTSRPQQCDAEPKAGPARPRQAQTDAHATAPRAIDQTQPATPASALPQAQLRSPREPKAPLAPPPPPPNPPPPPRPRRNPPLPPHPKPLRKDRAQALVARNYIPKRSSQRPHIQLPTKPNRQRDRVAPAAAFQPLQKPQPALPKRQRHLRWTLERTQRRPRGIRFPP